MSSRADRPSAAVALALGLLLLPPQPHAQVPTARRAAIVEGLLAYPVFYNGQAVRVRGVIEPSRGGVELVARGERILLFGADAARAAGGDATVEVIGTFLDVGRFTPDDPRLQQFGVVALTRQRFNRDWPGAGELLALMVETVEPADPFPAPSVRALALSPERYQGRSVTVVGRFRGRNLYGDLPRAPGVSRWDFVLQSADAAIWVVGRRPEGDGFDLDPDARADTGAWLQVQGPVRTSHGLVWIEATAIDAADPEAEPPRPPPAAPIVRPPPEVTFSLPFTGEDEAPRTGPIRIQFSRDMEPRSFDGQVRVAYREQAPPGSPASSRREVSVASTLAYDAGRRVLEIRLAQPLPPFTEVRVLLGGEIASTTGETLEPWSLAFTTGQ